MLSDCRVILLLVILLGCHSSNRSSQPSLNGQVIGNGGDNIRFLFEQGRQHAIGVLERLEELSPSSNSATREWFKRNRELVLSNLPKTEFVWQESLPSFCLSKGACACTQAKSRVTYLSYPRCALTVNKKEEVAKILLVEEHHRLNEGHDTSSEEKAADDFALAVYDQWRTLGHSESPHWLSMKEMREGGGFASFENGRLSVLGEEKIYQYEPLGDNWSEITLENSYRRFTTPAFKDLEIAVDGSFYVPSRTVAVDGKHYVFVQCPSRELKEGAGFQTSPDQPFWRPVPAYPTMQNRKGAQVFSAGGSIVLWGGYDCETNKRLIDGAIYDTKEKRWSSIPATDLLRVSQGERQGESAVLTEGTLWIWGGETRTGPDGQRDFAPQFTKSGAQFSFKTRTWQPISSEGNDCLPSRYASAVSLNQREVFWYDPITACGAKYNRTTDRWSSSKDNQYASSLSAPRAKRGGLFSSGLSVVFLASGMGSTGTYFYDVAKEHWVGNVFLGPALFSGMSLFYDSEPWQPFITEQWNHSTWTGMEWLVWYSNRGYRLYP